MPIVRRKSALKIALALMATACNRPQLPKCDPGLEGQVSRWKGGKVATGSEHDAVLESRVRVWFSGVAESCPGQSYAQVVEVM
jgi:hypothetical protein